MKNTVRSLLLIAAGVVAGAAIALGVERLVGKVGEERAKGDSLAVAPAAPRDTVREIRSLDELFAIDPRDTVIGSCNLSHLGLKVWPDFSPYTIRRLDLSYNELDDPDFQSPRHGLLPKGLEDLSLSHNKLCSFSFPNSLKRLDVSHNDLYGDGIWLIGYPDAYLGLAPINISKKTELRYLDISYNWHLYYRLPFDIDSVDTLIRVHTAKGYKIVRMWPEPLSSNPPKRVKIHSTRDTIIRKIMHEQ